MFFDVSGIVKETLKKNRLFKNFPEELSSKKEMLH